MSSLYDLAAVCELERVVDAIYYHTRRDWERMHLRWQHDMEEVRRTGVGPVYPEPIINTSVLII